MISASGQSERAAFGGPVLAAVGAAVLAFAYGPLLWEFAGNLWSRPYYQHFPYVLLAAGLLGYRDLQTPALASRPRFAVPPLALIVPAWLLLVLAIFALSPLLAAVSAILLAGGLLLAYSRAVGAAFPLGPWLLLWLLIPPPVGLDQRLLFQLQFLSSDLASTALDLLSVPHVMEGNTLILPSKQLFVDEACSGIVSVISLSTCAALYAVWRRRAFVPALLLMTAAVLWAVLLNVVRITAIALAESHYQLDLAEGTPHLLLGLGVFALNLLAIVALDWLITALVSPVGPRWAALYEAPLELGATLIAAWDRLTGGPAPQTEENLPPQQGEGGLPSQSKRLPKRALLTAATVAFAAAAVGQQLLPGQPASAAAAKLPVDQIVAALLEPGVMPDQLGELTLVGVEHIHRERDDINGEHSVVWEYRDAEGEAVMMSCDLPFVGGWHELSYCYAANGWLVTNRSTTPARGQPGELVSIDIDKPGAPEVLLTFCNCRSTGELLNSPQGIERSTSGLRLLSRITAHIDRRNDLEHFEPVIQLQLSLPKQNSRVGTGIAFGLLMEFHKSVFSSISRVGLSRTLPEHMGLLNKPNRCEETPRFCLSRVQDCTSQCRL